MVELELAPSTIMFIKKLEIFFHLNSVEQYYFSLGFFLKGF